LDIQFWTIVFRTVLVYIIILFIFRLMGKREIGELSILDLVVFIMLAEIAVFSVEEPSESFMHAFVPMIVLLIIQRGSALISLKSQSFREMVDGKPSMIIREGKIDEREMRKQRYNFDDLMQQLRENGTEKISDVDFAVLEPSGKLSVFENQGNSGEKGFITPLIADGKVQHENLKQNEKDEEWLIKELHKRGYENPKQISFLTVDNQNKWYIDEYDEKR